MPEQDIVDRLRSGADCHDYCWHRHNEKTLNEAADEIERLRKADVNHVNDYAVMKRERDRYRKALEAFEAAAGETFKGRRRWRGKAYINGDELHEAWKAARTAIETGQK